MTRLWLTAALALTVLVVAACDDDEPARPDGSGRGGAPTDVLRIDKSGWETDFAKHSVPLSEFQSGGPPRDGIPPVDEPRPTSQADADEWLFDREPVLAVAAGKQLRAYPTQILVWHEIVNDTLGGRPIAVTYCPLCNSSLVFDRRVDGRALTFGTTGNLRKSDLVMWDRQTESWWQQLSAEAVVGELTGTRLQVLPSQTLSWADFKRIHPSGDVLSRDTGVERDYGANPYAGYDQRNSEPFLFEGETDDRLPPKERVLAIFARRGTVVVPFGRLAREPVVQTEAGGRPVVVFYKRGVVSPLDAPSIEGSRDVGTAAALTRAWAAGRSASSGAATRSSTARPGRAGTSPGARWRASSPASGSHRSATTSSSGSPWRRSFPTLASSDERFDTPRRKHRRQGGGGPDARGAGALHHRLPGCGHRLAAAGQTRARTRRAGRGGDRGQLRRADRAFLAARQPSDFRKGFERSAA